MRVVPLCRNQLLTLSHCLNGRCDILRMTIIKWANLVMMVKTYASTLWVITGMDL